MYNDFDFFNTQVLFRKFSTWINWSTGGDLKWGSWKYLPFIWYEIFPAHREHQSLAIDLQIRDCTLNFLQSDRTNWVVILHQVWSPMTDEKKLPSVNLTGHTELYKWWPQFLNIMIMGDSQTRLGHHSRHSISQWQKKSTAGAQWHQLMLTLYIDSRWMVYHQYITLDRNYTKGYPSSPLWCRVA